MYPVSFIVLIEYSEITALKKELQNDPSLQSKIYIPRKAKRNPSGISEIRVTIQTQGNDHVKLVAQTIRSCGGTVKDQIDQGSPPWYIILGEFFKKVLPTAIPVYAAIVATTLSYQPVLNDPLSMWILFTAVGIPTSITIGSAHLIKLRHNNHHPV